jgi:hypothetical protein
MAKVSRRLCPGVKDSPVFIRGMKGGGGYEFECPHCRRVLSSHETLEDLKVPRHFIPNKGGPRPGSGAPIKDSAKKKPAVSFRIAPDVFEMLNDGTFDGMTKTEVIETAVRRYAARFTRKIGD